VTKNVERRTQNGERRTRDWRGGGTTRLGARTAAVTALAVTLALCRVEAAAVYLPGLAFRVLATPHFRIYFHQGGEAEARRLARIAEAVRSELQTRTRLPAPSLTHVVLANQDDGPNGSATVLPYPTVRLAAVWPAASDLVANTDDWLRMVFVHEYTHVIQLERTRGWAKVARAVLGRSPISFPNLFLPQWQIEGFATYWESRLTGLGRLNAGDAASIVEARARAGRLPLDQANGGVVAWPGGNTPYLEGAWFYDYLSNRFGEDTLGPLSDVTAGRFLYVSAPAFRQVFNDSLGNLWRDFQLRTVSKAAASRPGGPPSRLRRLTGHGYWVAAPRFGAGGTTVVYSLQDPHDFPTLRLVDLGAVNVEGGGMPPSRKVADRFGGRGLSVSGGLVFFDEIEIRATVALRSDIHVLELATGRTWRLTSDARLLEPDVSPDGRLLACVHVEADGTRSLALFEVKRHEGERVTLAPAAPAVPVEPGVTYGAPRWSPDGRTLAAERRRVGGRSEIVSIDTTTRAMRVLASAARGRLMTPGWTPGGADVVYASDVSGEFQIYACALGTGELRQLTFAPGGATFPDVSPDGRTLVFVAAGPEGHDVYALALDGSVATGGPVNDVVPGAAEFAPDSAPDTAVSTRGYSPFPTLLPRSWMPLADTSDGVLRVGFEVSATDVLARHSYALSALWRMSGDNGSGAPASRPDWSASYVYDRWLPAFFLSTTDTTSRLTLARPGDGPPLPAALREQNATAGVSWPVRRVRHTQLWQAALNAGVDTLSSGPAFDKRTRPAIRSAWAVSTGKEYGWSISTENGVAASVTSEQVRAALGADGDADAFTGELRAYWRPGRGHAVLAARVGGGTSSGDTVVRRHFHLGGSMPEGPLVDFSSDAFRMLRGFDDAVTVGNHVATASVEWRQPLIRLERGWGTVPVLVRNVHATVFLDAGQTWNTVSRLADVKTSLGAEAALDLVAGFGFRVTLTAGAAWTRDPAAVAPNGGAVYFRIGPSF
jgi:hypothetical protein